VSERRALAELADHMHRSANPVDVVVRVDAADLVKAASPAEGEADEALEARVERIEQLRFLVA
jgi:hypothetical protein